MASTGRSGDRASRPRSRIWDDRVMVVSLSDTDEPPPAAAPWWSRKPSASTIALGSSAALALALLFGLLLTPSLERAPPGVPDRSAISRAPAPPALPTRAPEPPAIPAVAVDVPVAADAPVQPPARPAAPASPVIRAQAATAPVRRPQRSEDLMPKVRAPAPAPAQERDVASRSAPSFNCRYARTTAELMVCDDPALAAADRRLAEAYRNAVRAGAPEAYLRRAQDRWLDVRENAAPDPDAVAEVYERRIDELHALSR